MLFFHAIFNFILDYCDLFFPPLLYYDHAEMTKLLNSVLTDSCVKKAWQKQKYDSLFYLSTTKVHSLKSNQYKSKHLFVCYNYTITVQGTCFDNLAPGKNLLLHTKSFLILIIKLTLIPRREIHLTLCFVYFVMRISHGCMQGVDARATILKLEVCWLVPCSILKIWKFR